MQRMIGVLMLATVACQAAAQPKDANEQRQWLLDQVRRGEALHRDDLVRDALGRLQLLEPRNPDVLLAALSLGLLLPISASLQAEEPGDPADGGEHLHAREIHLGVGEGGVEAGPEGHEPHLARLHARAHAPCPRGKAAARPVRQDIAQPQTIGGETVGERLVSSPNLPYGVC
mgnify:CR=1 FL=1